MHNKVIIYLIIIIVISLFIYFLYKPLKETFGNKEPVIPLHIYQTWHTKNLPPKMRECVNNLKRDNPEFKHHLYDDTMCRNFIKKNFDKNVLKAYDKLKPSAYKADLWRYCIMYKKGGIYMDIKLQCEPGFKLIELTDKEHYVLDRPYADENISIKEDLKIINNPDYYNNIRNKIDSSLWENNGIGLYNALLVCKPGNSLMNKCIQKCVENINNDYYRYNALYPTGPGLMGDLYFTKNYSKISDIDLFNSLACDKILNREKVIMRIYPEYRIEQKQTTTLQHYSYLWDNNDIYNG